MAAPKDAFFAAAKVGRVEDLGEILRGGLDPNVQDDLGNTALHWAAAGAHHEAVEAIIAGAAGKLNVNLQNALGETAAHKAGWKGSNECCSALVGAGIDLTLKNKEGQTAQEVAKDVAKASLAPVTAKLWEDEDESSDDSAASDSD